MMTIMQNQPTAAASAPAVEIATVSFRVAPLTAAMLSQVPNESILGREAATLRGEPIGKVCFPGKTQLLSLRGRNVRRGRIGGHPVTSKRNPARGSQLAGRSSSGVPVHDFTILAPSVDVLAETIAQPSHGGTNA
ncbi:MAG: hypothetical protein IPF57_03285 [Gammaproteobacteria bacterium]|jgi:hypothetical protein|nr:hypothetical protein [Gammaproteobacteria bacterium]MBK9466700.1 hypothetical protein [Gammaproteobacteria bacterium]